MVLTAPNANFEETSPEWRLKAISYLLGMKEDGHAIQAADGSGGASEEEEEEEEEEPIGDFEPGYPGMERASDLGSGRGPIQSILNRVAEAAAARSSAEKISGRRKVRSVTDWKGGMLNL